MNLFFRLLYTLIFSRFRSKIEPLGTCRTPFRCLPTDLDVLMHINNGMYFCLMDLARVDFMFRTGLLEKTKKQGWYPIVEAETIRFKKPITLFQKFYIDSQVIGCLLYTSPSPRDRG